MLPASVNMASKLLKGLLSRCARNAPRFLFCSFFHLFAKDLLYIYKVSYFYKGDRAQHLYCILRDVSQTIRQFFFHFTRRNNWEGGWGYIQKERMKRFVNGRETKVTYRFCVSRMSFLVHKVYYRCEYKF